MNIRNIFIETITAYEEKNVKISELDQKINKKNLELEALVEKKSALTKDGGELVMFKKNTDITLNVSYRECTNYEDVASDPHGRGSDREWADRNITALVTEIQFCFEKNSQTKNHYDSRNFFIKIICENDFFKGFNLLLNLEVDNYFQKGFHCRNVQINPKPLKADKDLRKLISYIKQKMSKAPL